MKNFKKFLVEEMQSGTISGGKAQTPVSQPQAPISSTNAYQPSQSSQPYTTKRSKARRDVGEDIPYWWKPSTPGEMFDPESWPDEFPSDWKPHSREFGEQPPSYDEWIREHPKPEPWMFDEDGDGVLSDEEREIYEREEEYWTYSYEVWEEQWNDWLDDLEENDEEAKPEKPEKPEKPQEPKPPLSYEEWQTQNPMPQTKDFDKNGDGALDDTEQREYEQAWERWRQSYEQWLREVQEWRRRPGQENFGSPPRPTPDVVTRP
jgi:hypothetical protein